MSLDDRRKERAELAITKAWPTNAEEVLDAVRDDDAFGALAWKLDHARRCGDDPVELLKEIGDDTLEWVIDEAHSPAAFLASRIPY